MHVRDFQTVKKGLYCAAMIMVFLFLNNLGFTQDEEKIVIGYEVRMQSTILEKEIQLSVHVPDDYSRSDERYPVLYIFQTHFEQVSGAVQNLYDYGLIPKIIVVSVDNYEFGYLTPTKVEANPNSGKADLFLKFFEKELFPYIDSKYRTHRYRIVFSNSWGAMFAAYAILAKPDVFNAAIASIPWITYDGENKYMINNVEKFLNNNEYSHFLYMSMDNESVILPDLETFLNVLKKFPKQGLEWEYHYWPDEDHTSTPYRSIYSGLRSLFGGWNQIPPDVAFKGLEDIKKYEDSLNRKFGYDIGISPSALRMAGQEHKRNSNYDEAISIFRFAIEKDPDNAFAYVSLGQAYEENSQIELAKEAYEKGYEIALSTSHPQVKWVKNFLDRILLKMNKEKKSVLTTSIDRQKVKRESSKNPEDSKFTPGEQTGIKGLYFGQEPPGLRPQIFAPGIVSTKNHREFSGTFTPDGKEYYFFRFAEGAGMMVSKLLDEGWTAPEPASFNTDYIDNEPHITPDGKIMYFNSNRPFPGFEGERRPTQIWFMERLGDSWGVPKHLCEGMFVTSSTNGNIYLNAGVTRLEDGRFAPIREIKGAFNAPPDGWKRGHHSSIAPDESFLIYDSQRSGSEWDSYENLFICFRMVDGTWSKSIDLGSKLNIPGGKMLATISPDNKYLFFCNRGDIYWVSLKIIEDLKPKERK